MHNIYPFNWPECLDEERHKEMIFTKNASCLLPDGLSFKFLIDLSVVKLA